MSEKAEKIYEWLVQKCGGDNDAAHSVFLRLLEKNRFAYYEQSQMTDVEVRLQISRIEIKNYYSEKLRRCYPESWRIALRVRQLLQKDTDFERFDKDRLCTVSSEIFGLSEWESSKPCRATVEVDRRIEPLPIEPRNFGERGRYAAEKGSQLIISNANLKNLMRRIFVSADSPLSVERLRQIVMSRLVLLDAVFSELYNPSQERETDFACSQESAEEYLIRREREGAATKCADEFLTAIFNCVRGKSKQFKRMIKILQMFYLSNGKTQLEISETLGVSDSLVSNYRQRIEICLKNLPLGSRGEAACFEVVLRQKLQNFNL